MVYLFHRVLSRSPFSWAAFCAITTDMEQYELYHQEELTAARAAQKRTGRAMGIVGAAGLLACILICCLATRQNQSVTLPMTIGASVLSGWIVIFLSHSRYDVARARSRHAELMLTGPRERLSGRFEKLAGTYRVKKGVSIRKVRLWENDHETLLTVADEKAADLPDGFVGAVETVYDCIVAFAAEDPAETTREAQG